MEQLRSNPNVPDIEIAENSDLEEAEESSSRWTNSPRVEADPVNFQYTVLLQFTDPNNDKEYRKYMKNQKYTPSFWIFILLILAVALARANYYASFTLGPMHIFTIFTVVMHIITILEFLIYIVGRQFQMLTGRMLWKPLQTSLNFIIDGIFCDELESIIALSLTTSFVFTLIGRVLVGQCPDDVDL